MPAVPHTSVTALMDAIRDVGRTPATQATSTQAPGYTRPGFSNTERTLRDWFIAEAAARFFDVEIDSNGITWAWVTPPGPNAVVTGSHLDSVPGGGEFDGPLGVASALAAVDLLRQDGRLPNPRTHNSAARLPRPLAIAVFPEEEGSRFGVACLGSRLLTGAIDPPRALALTDADGTSFAEVASTFGLNPHNVGASPETNLGNIGSFIELHVEQGVGLINMGAPVAIGGAVVGHGRWRLTFTGQGNHAGTTPMGHRADPVVAASAVIGAIPGIVTSIDTQAVGTVGRTRIHPGGTNVIASRMDVWLDVRHRDDEVVGTVVEAITNRAHEVAHDCGVEVSVGQESYSATTRFDAGLTSRLQGVLPTAPVLDTGAGHDAGILAGYVDSAMLFVRNPTGVSHAPEEACEPADQHAGVVALADALAMELGVANGAGATGGDA